MLLGVGVVSVLVEGRCSIDQAGNYYTPPSISGLSVIFETPGVVVIIMIYEAELLSA